MTVSINVYVIAVWKTTNNPRDISCDIMKGGILSRESFKLGSRRWEPRLEISPTFSSSERDRSFNSTNLRDIIRRALPFVRVSAIYAIAPRV
jgi:hypothetical protein